MKKNKLSLRGVLSVLAATAFVFALTFGASAQRRFEPKAVEAETEVKNFAQFAQDLVNFIKQAQAVEEGGKSSEADRKKLQDLGRRITDGTSNARTNLQGLIAKIKKANRWNDDFDTDFLESITNSRVKALINRTGGARKALAQAEAALNSLKQDVDATVNDSKTAGFFSDEAVFINASFSSRRAGKVRVKCVLLGIGVAAAELAKMKLTAENLDNLFDSNKCGTAAPAT